jgi:branched-chain amino acid transport system ATP-binding protein
MLEIENLVVAYGSHIAVQSVSITAHSNAITAVLGANGAGKSSLLRAISGIAPVRGGKIILAGEDITNLSAVARAKMGVAQTLEGRRIFRKLTVEENLELAWKFGRRRLRWEAAVDRVYQTFPVLHEKRKNLSGFLSGGQQQMMIVSAATITDPQLLLLDEPSLGLSPIMRSAIYKFLSDRCRENSTTVLLAEQMAALAINISRFAYVLKQGTVVENYTLANMSQGEVKNMLASAYF